MNIWSKKMVINSEDYVLTPIYLYLKNMLNVIGYQPISFQFRPAIYYIFSNTFLQMVGALEKKLEMISWYISQNDYDYRYNYIHGNSQISANLQQINSTCKHLTQNKDSIMQNDDYKNRAYEKILELFSDSQLINYTNSEFWEFKQKCPHVNKSNELDNLYKQTILFRHNIAHNIKSVYKNPESFSELIKNDIIYNWYFKFMILLLADFALIDNFEQYIKNNAKIKW